ncbi:MAG: hypothetical protein D6791_09870, partial [Chloroflexi bacterium]
IQPSSRQRKKPLCQRLLRGQFRWRLMNTKLVERVCAPLTILYEPLSVLLALVLVVASRWALFRSIDWHFYGQVMAQFNPGDYLLSLGLLIAVVLVHEFGHAAAQLRFGLPPGPIGFQLYLYIPAFFANVDASWKLKPSRRIVIDLAGIYFQTVAASVLYLMALETNFTPLLTTALASDSLCLIAINPFLRFDGYWLLADALAVPNLRTLSQRLLAHYWKRLLGREAPGNILPIGRARAATVTAYAILRNGFWLFVVFAIVRNLSRLYAGASATLWKFLSQGLDGVRSLDGALVASSLIRMVLFVLLLLTMSALLANTAVKVWQLARAGVEKARCRPQQSCQSRRTRMGGN